MIKLFCNIALAITAYFSCHPIHSASETYFGDLMLSAQERKTLDVIRKGQAVQNSDHKKAASTAITRTKKVHINGFYYIRDERRKPIVWVDGEQATNRNLAPSLTVKGVKRDKQTLVVRSQKKAKSHAIKAGQIMNIVDGTVHEAHEK